MVSLRTIATVAGLAVGLTIAACGPPGVTAPPDPAAVKVASMVDCPAPVQDPITKAWANVVTTFNEGQNPPCRPVDHTADGTGLPSQRLNMVMNLTNRADDPTFTKEIGHCQGQTPATGYGGTAYGVNAQTMKLTCAAVDVYLVWSALIAPARVSA